MQSSRYPNYKITKVNDKEFILKHDSGKFIIKVILSTRSNNWIGYALSKQGDSFEPIKSEKLHKALGALSNNIPALASRVNSIVDYITRVRD